MTDCAHWLEPMLDAEKEELRAERSAHRRDVYKAQRLINDIRALINSADAHFANMRLPFKHPGLDNGLFGGDWPF